MPVVIRPVIPYRGSIPNGLHEGKLIEIKGTPMFGGDVFEFNLLTGLDPSSDRPLHISVRFNGRVVVRNHLEMGGWGREERHGIFPFQSGREFTVMISVEASCYRIAVNRQHCWEFKHRLPFQRVSSIHIDGPIQIEKIEFIDRITAYQPGVYVLPPTVVYPSNQVYPGYITSGIAPIPAMPSFPMPGIPSIGTCIPPPEQICPQPSYPSSRTNLSPVYNPSIPYAYPIYGGLQPGMMIYISGRPAASAYKFTLNLQAGTNPYPPPDIAFHLDVRFFNHSIVRNSRINDNWDREETIISHFPFQQSVNFDMIIRVDPERYMIALNGQHFIEFRHRLSPLQRFDTLYIENDIVVSSIRFA